MAFKEALATARAKDVDFILLGGDLFHMNRPSSNIEHKCIKIIRQHMNAPAKRGVSFKRVKGNFSHFHKINHANFEDDNLNVPYPIMTIHGNHDDPTGSSAKSICEKLATCGLLNYFGALKPNVTSIIIEPIVLQKGSVKIALYGLGFISDHKLKRAFDNEEVVFIEPPKDSYNILVVHQNRVKYNEAKYIPDNLFPLNFHLIIRGHEHDTQEPEPIPESEVGGLVYQPGSTVATSVSSLEMSQKKVGVFKISLNTEMKSKFNVDYELVNLKCCRRMLLKDISQKNIYTYIKSKAGTQVLSSEFKRLSKEYVVDVIEEMLKEDESKRSQDSQKTKSQASNDSEFKLERFSLPLIRIRVEFVRKSERFDEFEIGSMFYPNRVANKDIVLFKKQKIEHNVDGQAINATFQVDDRKEDLLQDFDEFEHVNLGEEKRDIDVMIENYFKDKIEEDRLQALSLSEYTDAVRGSSEDGNVISKVISQKKMEILKRFKNHLSSKELSDQFLDETFVRNWFLQEFKTVDGSAKVAADKLSLDEAGDEDSDVMVCE